MRSRLQRTRAGYAVGLSAVLVVLGCLVLASATVQAQDTSPVVTYPLPDVAAQPPIGDLDEDGINNADDRCPTLPGDLLDGCQRDLNADVRAAWRVNRYYSRLLSLTVRAPIGSRIELRCRARSERTCRFEKKTIFRTRRRTTNLAPHFNRARTLPPGTSITVRAKQPLLRGSFDQLLTRSGRRLPRVTTRCLSEIDHIQFCY